MEVAKVTSKGQITIPISIRRSLEINEGDKILFIYKPGGVMMVNPNKLQGDMPEDVVEASEAEVAPEVVTAPKEKNIAKAKTPGAETKKAKAPTVTNDEPKQKPKAVNTPAPKTPAESEKPNVSSKPTADFDLNSLLDDLRSIGSI